jgi:hypothetical protein
LLKRLGCLAGGADEGAIPPQPAHRPQFGDELPQGVCLFRTWAGSGRPFGLQPSGPEDEEGGIGGHDLENLTLPPTFFGRSEISRVSFKNTSRSG